MFVLGIGIEHRSLDIWNYLIQWLTYIMVHMKIGYNIERHCFPIILYNMRDLFVEGT
jgi:hypothetical protein